MKTTFTGVDSVNNMFRKIAPRQAKNIMRSTIHGVAGTIRDDAKNAMPVDTGVMKKATKARRERVRFGIIRSTVRVEKSAFYWRFVEYGQGPNGVEVAMFLRAVEKFRSNIDRVFTEQFGKKFEAALKRAAKRNGN